VSLILLIDLSQLPAISRVIGGAGTSMREHYGCTRCIFALNFLAHWLGEAPFDYSHSPRDRVAASFSRFVCDYSHGELDTCDPS